MKRDAVLKSVRLMWQSRPLPVGALWIVGMLTHWLVALAAVLVVFSPLAEVYLRVDDFRKGLILYALAPATLYAAFAGIYLAWPKLFGWRLDERLGKVHFWGTIICFNGIALPLLVLGVRAGESVMWLRQLPLLGTYGLVFYQLPFVWAVLLGFFGEEDVVEDFSSVPRDRTMQHSELSSGGGE